MERSTPFVFVDRAGREFARFGDYVIIMYGMSNVKITLLRYGTSYIHNNGWRLYHFSRHRYEPFFVTSLDRPIFRRTIRKRETDPWNNGPFYIYYPFGGP